MPQKKYVWHDFMCIRFWGGQGALVVDWQRVGEGWWRRKVRELPAVRKMVLLQVKCGP